jgi:hypothetical protein
VPVTIITAKQLTDEDRRRINHQVQAILKKTDDLAGDLKHLLEHAGTPAITAPLLKTVAASADTRNETRLAPPDKPVS